MPYQELSMPDWLEIIMRLAAAALVGGGIGLNRHLHHKAVGLRTLSLVSCGAAGLVLISFRRVTPSIFGTDTELASPCRLCGTTRR
jgi:uncharacterized membrane protein YhiD involved in acid resistance